MRYIEGIDVKITGKRERESERDSESKFVRGKSFNEKYNPLTLHLRQVFAL